MPRFIQQGEHWYCTQWECPDCRNIYGDIPAEDRKDAAFRESSRDTW